MSDERKKLPARFFRSSTGNEPVREWLLALSKADRKKIGVAIGTVEYGWPIGMPTCRSMGKGLWEVRSELPQKRIARVLFCIAEGNMILLHGFIKKTRKTPRQTWRSRSIGRRSWKYDEPAHRLHVRKLSRGARAQG